MERKGYLVVVSCGAEKIWRRYPSAGPTPARDAYTSSVFTKSRAYAERFASGWKILSAKYGFISPDFIIPENYNVSFYDADAISPATLRQQVAEIDLTQIETVGMLGSDTYWTRVASAFADSGLTLVHVNGNISFPPLFHRLVADLIASDTPFRMDRA